MSRTTHPTSHFCCHCSVEQRIEAHARRIALGLAGALQSRHVMPIEIVLETHALSKDNERGIATGWLPGGLCERGRARLTTQVSMSDDLAARWAAGSLQVIEVDVHCDRDIGRT